MYFGQMMEIKDGYISRNLAALRSSGTQGEKVEHVQFSTEAGYAFVLYAVEKVLGSRAVFHVNAVLFTLMLLSLAWFLRAASGDGRRGWLAGMFFLFILMLPKISRREAMHLCELLRDPASLLLCFVALTVAILSIRRYRWERRMALLAGIALGLSAWFRLTGVLFGIPIGLYLLLAPSGWAFRRRVRACVFLGLGALIGLTPLIAQNVLEGESVLEAGQIGTLFRPGETPANGGDEVGLEEGTNAVVAPDDVGTGDLTTWSEKTGLPETEKERLDRFRADKYRWRAEFARSKRLDYARKTDQRPEGFHPMYFRIWFPRVARRSIGAFGPYAFVVLICAITSVVFARRYALLLLSTALMLLVFYSFYDKIVWRYLYQGSILIAASASLGAAGLADRLLGYLAGRRVRIAASAVLILVVSAPLTKRLWREGDGVVELGKRWQKTRSMQEEMERVVAEGDLYISYDQDFRRWFDYWAGDIASTTKWGTGTRRAARKATIDEILDRGKGRAFFLSKLRDGKEQVSWWKDDLLNEYDMQLVGKRFRGKFHCYRLMKRSTLRREVPLSSLRHDDRHIYLFARKLSVQERWQTMTLSAADGGDETEVRIQTGPNILPLPSGVDLDDASVVLSSTRPLPSFIDAMGVGHDPARRLWCSYEHMPSLCFVSEFNLYPYARWFGYKRWKRDWGGYDRKHMSYPMWQMPPGSFVRLPRVAEDMTVRLYFSAYHLGDFTSEAESSLPAELKTIRYRLGDAEFGGQATIMRPMEKRREWGAVEYVHRISIPAIASRQASKPDLEIQYDDLVDWDILLYQTEFAVGPAVQPVSPATEALSDVPARAWRTKEDDSIWGRGGWLDPSFRVLAREQRVFLGPAFGSTAAVLVFYWPSDRQTDRCVVRVDAGVEPAVSCALEPRPGLQPFLVPLPPGAQKASLLLVPEYEHPPACLPALNFVFPADLSQRGRAFTFTMDPAENVDLLAEGFWPPELKEDGSYLRWTKERATVMFSVADPSRRLKLALTVRGVPRQAGAVPVKMLVNGQEIGSFEVTKALLQSHSLEIPNGVLTEGMNKLTIATKTWKPSEVMKSEDTRSLGVYVKSIEWAVIPD